MRHTIKLLVLIALLAILAALVLKAADIPPFDNRIAASFDQTNQTITLSWDVRYGLTLETSPDLKQWTVFVPTNVVVNTEGTNRRACWTFSPTQGSAFYRWTNGGIIAIY